MALLLHIYLKKDYSSSCCVTNTVCSVQFIFRFHRDTLDRWFYCLHSNEITVFQHTLCYICIYHFYAPPQCGKDTFAHVCPYARPYVHTSCSITPTLMDRLETNSHTTMMDCYARNKEFFPLISFYWIIALCWVFYICHI